VVLAFSASAQEQQPGWWMREPIRWMDQLADMHANVLLMGMGGIVAYYPTGTPFHYPSPNLPPRPRHVRRRCPVKASTMRIRSGSSAKATANR